MEPRCYFSGAGNINPGLSILIYKNWLAKHEPIFSKIQLNELLPKYSELVLSLFQVYVGALWYRLSPPTTRIFGSAGLRVHCPKVILFFISLAEMTSVLELIKKFIHIISENTSLKHLFLTIETDYYPLIKKVLAQVTLIDGILPLIFQLRLCPFYSCLHAALYTLGGKITDANNTEILPYSNKEKKQLDNIPNKTLSYKESLKNRFIWIISQFKTIECISNLKIKQLIFTLISKLSVNIKDTKDWLKLGYTLINNSLTWSNMYENKIMLILSITALVLPRNTLKQLYALTQLTPYTNPYHLSSVGMQIDTFCNRLGEDNDIISYIEPGELLPRDIDKISQGDLVPPQRDAKYCRVCCENNLIPIQLSSGYIVCSTCAQKYNHLKYCPVSNQKLISDKIRTLKY